MVLVSCEYALRQTGPTVFPGIPVGLLSSTCTDRMVGVVEGRGPCFHSNAYFKSMFHTGNLTCCIICPIQKGELTLFSLNLSIMPQEPLKISIFIGIV